MLFRSIIKPNFWKWEYSEPNPYPQSPKYCYQKCYTSCNNCVKNAEEVELFRSEYLNQIYCVDCLQIFNYDISVNNYKFEPLIFE